MPVVVPQSFQNREDITLLRTRNTCDHERMEIKEYRLLLFIKLYREQYGVELGREEAYKKASLLLHYASLCVRPLAKLDEREIMEQSNESE